MDGTGSGSCRVAGSGISAVEPSGSATREFKGTGCEDGRWMELAQWTVSVLAVFVS
jgi:hypothetical protein